MTPPPTSDEIISTEEFEQFIRRYFKGHEETKVIRVQKNKILTNNNFCEMFGKAHGQMCFVVDKKGYISLGCPCKDKKSFKLLPSMFKKITK
jgi:hypothetical protein